jgi:thioredoxin-like negative regulator of GroEL
MPLALGGNGYLDGMGQSPSPRAPSANSRAKNVRDKKIATITKPEDLLEFVLEDERLSIVKVYAGWCRTCKAFDLKWRKLAHQEGGKFDPKGKVVDPGRVRFAEMDFNANEELCRLLNATRLPYIIMYKGSQGKVDDFQCGPANFAQVIQKVNEYADAPEVSYLETVATTQEPARDLTKELAGPQKPHTAEAKELWEKDVVIAKLNNELGVLKIETENALENSREHLRQKETRLKNMETRLKQIKADHNKEMMIARKDLLAEKASKIKALEIRLEGTVAELRMQIEAIEIERGDLQLELNASIRANDGKVEELESRIAVYEKERKSLRRLSALALQRIKGAFAIRQHIKRMRSAVSRRR